MTSIIITGANSGIGFECAMQMAKIAPDEQIILACRNVESGNQAIRKIKKKTNHTNIICLALDLASLQSVRDFKTAISKLPNPVITSIVNNAGAIFDKFAYTKDGYEMTFGTNHLGGFYLTLLMLPYLHNNGSIVFTASDTHDPTKNTGSAPPNYTSASDLAFPKVESEKLTIKDTQRLYATSKLCNVLTTYILQEKLVNTNIRVNAFDPGLTPGTGLIRFVPAPVRLFLYLSFRVQMLYRHNTNLPQISGSRLANLSYAKEFQNLKGIYFSDGKVTKSSQESYSKDFQNDLWKSSIELTGIKTEDTNIPLN
ncbi:SDR family NAD(P)-dependent oxidoreductase [Pedobacter psychroterrae]|uniref:SDR family NAD(P)-dependent oxidoreductase n=1 Tax=Pedobacter psychroterrae TaxID=2530453 RepID=A0A4R0NUH0_9SPHI|nr:SDR family NAD(P)-dependent oxidoreductase [Pedobacter psychroterrae]TCD03135.1 SDR family NAD(P)-dependent oxidoreductase [Pedobacter psychroterrae]